MSNGCCGPGNDDDTPRGRRIGLIAIVILNGLVAVALITTVY